MNRRDFACSVSGIVAILRITHCHVAERFYSIPGLVSRRAIVLSIFAGQFCGFSRDLPPTRNTIVSVDSKKILSRVRDTEKAEMLYLRGVAFGEVNGTPKDESKAAVLYRQAAGQHYAPAEYNLALLYEEGRGVAKDLFEAARWYRAAAEQGDAEAQNNLGRLYALGHGLPLDAGQASYWYGKAAEQGNVEGQNNLANSYREGRGVRQDLTKAFQLYKTAAMTGYPVAQNNLGLMYANGTGTDRDYCLAYAWLSVAAEKLPASRKLMEQVQSKMTSEEIVQAKRARDELRAQVTPIEDGISNR
jgi:TPR repeat protein